MSREEKIEYISEKLKEADDDILDEIYWALELEGWKEVIRMYLIHRKGVWTHRDHALGGGAISEHF